MPDTRATARSTFFSAIDPPQAPDARALCFAFAGDRLLVRDDGDAAGVPELAGLAHLGLEPQRRHYLGALAGVGCWAAELPEDATPPGGYGLEPLRGLYGRLPDEMFAVAGRAIQIVDWDRTHQFCGRCGAPTEYLAGERAKVCPRCGLAVYPRLSPAVIVAVTRGEELLLARGHHFPEGMYSVLAGFVEPGESLEEAVERELFEEVGIRVAGVRYYGSQPWPYPNSLMVGFTAEHAGGELRPDEREIADAGWYRRDALPRIPGRPSIARRLIDSWVENSHAER